ncbi:hypothetical protein LCGC14_1866990, partial [marine sediment metagenome]
PTIVGEQFFGLKRIKADITTTQKVIQPKVTIQKPSELITTKIRTLIAEPTVAVAKSIGGKTRFRTVTIGGKQITTAARKFRGKDFFIRSETDIATGKTVTKIFKGDKLIKTIETVEKPNITFTEPIKKLEAKRVVKEPGRLTEEIKFIKTAEGVSLLGKGITGRRAIFTRESLRAEVVTPKVRKRAEIELDLIFNKKYEDFKPMLFGLNNCNSFSECLTLFGEIKIVLRNTLDEIVKIDSETLKEIFMQINQSNEYYFKDIASRLNIVLSRRSRKIKGFLEVKDKDFELMVKITEILKNIELSRFFGNVLPHEDVISKTLADILRQKKIPNVTLKKKLSGTSHIDITSGVTIAIEVKKIYSNKSKDELIGQLNEDLRIGNYHYGIGYGIDTTKSQLHARDNLVNVDFPRNRIVLVIKPNIT